MKVRIMTSKAKTIYEKRVERALKQGIYNIFTWKKCRLLLSLLSEDNVSIMNLARKLHTTHFITAINVRIFEHFYLVETRRRGRVRYVRLTSDGKEIAKHIWEIFKIFEKIKEKGGEKND
jgi:DNA-binding MarR family transcriptional regulator